MGHTPSVGVYENSKCSSQIAQQRHNCIFLGCAIGQSVEWASHVQRLCLHRRSPKFNFAWWSFAACHSPSFSPSFPAVSSAFTSNKGTKASKKLLTKNPILHSHNIKPYIHLTAKKQVSKVVIIK